MGGFIRKVAETGATTDRFHDTVTRQYIETQRSEERLHQPWIKPTTCEGCGAPKVSPVCSYCKRNV
jgi:hypothetical protein